MTEEERAKLRPLAVELAKAWGGDVIEPGPETQKAIDAVADLLLDQLDAIEVLA